MMADTTSTITFRTRYENAGAQAAVNDLQRVAQEAKNAGASVSGALSGGGALTLTRVTGLYGLISQTGLLSTRTAALARDSARAFGTMATQGAGAEAAMAGLGVAVGAVSVAVSALKKAWQMGTAAEPIVQAEKRLIAFSGSAAAAADVISKMQAAADGGMTAMDAMTYGSRLLSMGLADSADKAAELTRGALMLGPAAWTAEQKIYSLTMLLSNQSVRRLDEFGLGVDRIRQKQEQLVAGGMDKQIAFTNAVLEEMSGKVAQVEAAGGTAATGIDKLTTAWANLRSEVGKKFEPAVNEMQTGIADIINNLTAIVQSGSSDPMTRLLGLRTQLAALREEQAQVASGQLQYTVSPSGFVTAIGTVDDYTAAIARLEAEIAALQPVSDDMAERLRAAGIEADKAATGTDAISEALDALRTKDEAARVNAVAMAIFRGEITLAEAAMLGLNAAYDLVTGKNWTDIARSTFLVDRYNNMQTATTSAEEERNRGWGALRWQADQKAERDAKAAEEAEKERLLGVKRVQTAAERAADAIANKFTALANTITTAIEDAQKKARGLFDFGGGGAGGIVTEPGKNGPFEALYRITDVAATLAGRAPGADTAKWQAMYGNIDYTATAQAFQQGNLLAPGVFENIDWQLLGQQATQQQEASKISTYAGQAVAGLMSAGKPLTAENIKSMIDQLAAADKEGIVPSLDAINTALANTDSLRATEVASVIAALGNIEAALTKPPTTPPPPSGSGSSGSSTTTVPISGAFASGTDYAPGGLALVGERGPELLNIARGGRVYSAQETRLLLGSGSAGQADAFLTGLVRAIGAKARDMEGAAQTTAEMLVSAATGRALRSMVKALS